MDSNILLLLKKQINLIRIICFFWFVAKILTFKTWIAYRNLPVVALFDFLNPLPEAFHAVLYALALILLIASIVKPNIFLLVMLVFVETLSISLDVLRLQPWEYLYLFIVSFYIFYFKDNSAFRRILILLLASTYFFSGAHKISSPFLNNVWDNFILGKIFNCSKPVQGMLHYSGLFVGITEIAIGVVLLFNNLRKWAIYLGVLMHLLILFFLGIVLKGFNFVVLPWNIAMIFILAYVYLNQDIKNEGYNKLTLRLNLIITLFWFILPASNIFGYWFHYLSSGMYSGKTHLVFINYNDCSQLAFLGKYKKRPLGKKDSKLYGESVNEWITDETGVAAFPEIWYYNSLRERLCEKYKNCNVEMYYYKYPDKVLKEIR